MHLQGCSFSGGSVMLGFSILVACILGRVIAYTGRLRGGGFIFIFSFSFPSSNQIVTEI